MTEGIEEGEKKPRGVGFETEVTQSTYELNKTELNNIRNTYVLIHHPSQYLPTRVQTFHPFLYPFPLPLLV